MNNSVSEFNKLNQSYIIAKEMDKESMHYFTCWIFVMVPKWNVFPFTGSLSIFIQFVKIYIATQYSQHYNIFVDAWFL